MSYHFEQYYRCGEKRFYNIFQAFKEQSHTGHFPEYVIDHDLIENLKGFTRPRNIDRKTLQALMVRRLKEIRKKYNKLRLAYTGGTDSYTILKLCVENDIYIDETITHMISIENNLRTNLELVAGLRLAKEHEGKSIGVCTEFHPSTNDLDFVNDPDWYLDEKLVPGTNITNRFFSLPHALGEVLSKNDGGVVLTGFEKPRFLIEDGILKWCTVDCHVGDVMGLTKTIPFFLDKENPELVVSMSYAMLDRLNIQDLLSKDQLIGWNTFGRHKMDELLTHCGFYSTPHVFINHALLGKTNFNLNRKTKRFHNELRKLGHEDFVNKVFKTHDRILALYGDLPHALQTEGQLVKATTRFSQKIPILRHKFAS